MADSNYYPTQIPGNIPQDYSVAKPTLGSVSQPGAVATDWNRVEALLSSENLQKRFLFGIPLVSGFADPITNKRERMNEGMLKDYIIRAVGQAELELHIDIFPTIRVEKYPFDRNLYESLGYIQLEHKPVSNLFKFSVTPSNGVDVYVVPLTWVETAKLVYGQIFIIPLTIAITNAGYIPSTAGAGGAAFLSILGQKSWINSYWEMTYESGFPSGQIPIYINELVGCMAAIDILSDLAATYSKSTSKSISLDGGSQSISGPGPQIFTQRIKDLEERKKLYVQKIKNLFGHGIQVAIL